MNVCDHVYVTSLHPPFLPQAQEVHEKLRCEKEKMFSFYAEQVKTAPLTLLRKKYIHTKFYHLIHPLCFLFFFLPEFGEVDIGIIVQKALTEVYKGGEYIPPWW